AQDGHAPVRLALTVRAVRAAPSRQEVDAERCAASKSHVRIIKTCWSADEHRRSSCRCEPGHALGCRCRGPLPERIEELGLQGGRARRAAMHSYRRDAPVRAQQRARLAQAARWRSDVAMASVFEKHGKYYARWKDAA